MKCHLVVLTASVFVAAAAHIPTLEDVKRTTAERVSEYNYPVEVHEVHTEDGYILTLFRIPYSTKLQNQNESRPVAYLQHGLLSSSDDWILNGPDDALSYLLVDAGYDVWLGNARGNRYSKKHERLSTWLPKFWEFSFHEVALYDISAVIDYMLDTTNESAIHYVGHSMGTTVFFTLLSLRPEYNAKIKTAHMLAPVAFLGHTTSPVDYLAPVLGHQTIPAKLLANNEILSFNLLSHWFMSIVCAESSSIQPLCVDFINFLSGWDSSHINRTLLSDLFQSHPAGESTTMVIHYAQEFESGYYRQFDHGAVGNLLRYHQISPPDYDLTKVVAPVRLYYSDNDYYADVTDVKTLEGFLPNLVESFHVPYPDWNHLDFLYAWEVKDTINDRVVNAANHFEATGDQ